MVHDKCIPGVQSRIVAFTFDVLGHHPMAWTAKCMVAAYVSFFSINLSNRHSTDSAQSLNHPPVHSQTSFLHTRSSQPSPTIDSSSANTESCNRLAVQRKQRTTNKRVCVCLIGLCNCWTPKPHPLIRRTNPAR